ncbi:MAG: hypothetical protein HS117_22100 [Verrucomicrobiaceae bacterium]|jgi:hypothetical protein|nr:hypothetical protein [Verrucomicrobiaceae bacterium]
MLQTTILALLGLTAGLVLHFRWHPLRREFSDAWDFLRSHQALVPLCAGCLLLAGGGHGFSPDELEDWRALWLPLMRRAVTEMVVLFHATVPAWPLALLLPLALLILTIRVWRWPYRYGERVPVPEQKLVLVALSAGTLLWAGTEAAAMARAKLPEWLEMLKTGGRWLFVALTTAGVQVWLARLMVAWERPPDTEAERDTVAALESSFARWQNVFLLGAFNLVWMTWRAWRADENGPAAWLLPEFLALFAALPLITAVTSGSRPFWQVGAVALKALLRGLPWLLMLVATGAAVWTLVLYMTSLLAVHAGAHSWAVWPVRCLTALVLALLHLWLAPAAMLVILRRGMKVSGPNPAA